MTATHSEVPSPESGDELVLRSKHEWVTLVGIGGQLSKLFTRGQSANTVQEV